MLLDWGPRGRQLQWPASKFWFHINSASSGNGNNWPFGIINVGQNVSLTLTYISFCVDAAKWPVTAAFAAYARGKYCSKNYYRVLYICRVLCVNVTEDSTQPSNFGQNLDMVQQDSVFNFCYNTFSVQGWRRIGVSWISGDWLNRISSGREDPSWIWGRESHGAMFARAKKHFVRRTNAHSVANARFSAGEEPMSRRLSSQLASSRRLQWPSIITINHRRDLLTEPPINHIR